MMKKKEIEVSIPGKKIKFIVQTDKPKGCSDFFNNLFNLNKKGEKKNG